MEPEVRKAPIRFYEIDLLRFVAALSVVFFHYTFRGYAADNFSPLPFLGLGQITRYGYLGVQLFFIVSGYVVLLSAQGKTVRQFFLSRVTRLYPAYWVACTLTFAVKYFWGTTASDAHMSLDLHTSWTQYIYGMTMLHEFVGIAPIDGVYATLTVEITFYFLIAVLVGFGLLRHVDWFLVAWLGYAALPLTHYGTGFAFLFFPANAPFFAAGMLFYLLQQPQGRTPLRYALLVVAYYLAIRSGQEQINWLASHYHEVFRFRVVAGLTTLFFGAFALIASRKIDLSRFTWLAWLGALTYPLYLLHSDIAFVAFHRLGTPANKYVLVSATLAIMLGAAYAINRFVEKRLSKPLGRVVSNLLVRFDHS
ncbi:acyltransferase family protein [Hymenobacter sp. PAMC 26628]|uniref:acyltransferase family protein n=1 Tax=Hymenobacter sp. PAMC 26628 TaxID=1484118 RepID=UPI00076FE668|nr:acyltransferase [Hymenobacter sp. PAMC 26628]AMJ65034.1 hypothetical protein AXW84_06035 [Hymenobacter sp. PAMC 26628]